MGKAQLPQRSANVSKMSRRHTKLEKRRPEVDAPRQPKCNEAVGQEEQRAQVPWLMGNLEQMSVPAFSTESASGNNGSSINYSL